MRKVATLAFALLMVVGCTNQEEFQQLSHVAKGWCLTIRASQVIPIYPLSEDIQVGDLYIVQKPLEDEVYEYEKSGFLPLGENIGRLPEPELINYYKYGTAVNPNPPMIAVAQSPTTQPSDPKKPSSVSAGGATTRADVATVHAVSTSQPSSNDEGSTANSTASSAAQYWADLPLSAFPSYSFEIDRSGGLNAQLPIHGIPVAFGLLGAESASVTVTLSNASTYGLDEESLDRVVREWAEIPCNKKYLKSFAPYYTPPKFLVPIIPGGTEFHKHYNYLRAISRVYFIRGVNVTVTNNKQSSSNLSAGQAPALTLLNATSTSQPTIGGATAQATPTTLPSNPVLLEGDTGVGVGGQLKLSSLSNSSVTLDETFSRPMAIGYLAFDLPIGEDGSLGICPVSTQVRLFGLSGGISETTVGEWAKNDPNAEGKLDDWLKSTNNDPSCYRNIPPPVTAEKLRQYLIEHAPNSIEYWLPVWGYIILLKEESPLYRRISEDVIQRPIGLLQPEPATQPATQPTGESKR